MSSWHVLTPDHKIEPDPLVPCDLTTLSGLGATFSVAGLARVDRSVRTKVSA